MPVAEFQKFMTDLKHEENGGKFWKHRWITKVDGRYKDGKKEYKIECEPAPSCGKYLLHWWRGMSEETFEMRKKECKKKGMDMTHKQYCTLPCGEKKFQAVWLYQD
ncbi:hypothetical protein SCARR_01852 [Pontiella sulfatireligans]|uniref:Uncharacterized protein n=2 Tax=Pontiella sulfatireligans TaxID=2750658 RepID=A0A6C2UIT7_9BACT|nr:hypothetical protein SCARR_01852 [Pontiella sulfatireligans]